MSKALSIAVQSGCLKTLERLKIEYDKGNYILNMIEQDNLLRDAAFSEKMVKAMCSWQGSENLLTFGNTDKTQVFFAALNIENFKLAKYLISKYPISLRDLDSLINDNKVDPVNNRNYEHFFKSLRNNNKTILFENAVAYDIEWIKPYVFDEKVEKMVSALVLSAVEKNNIELIKEYFDKYQISEFMILGVIQSDELSKEIRELLLSKLSLQYKTALLILNSIPTLIPVLKTIIELEISEQYKIEAFAIALIQGSEEFIDLVKNSQFWKERKLQLLELVLAAPLEEIQDFMNNNEICQDVLQSGWLVASSRGNQEITQYLFDSLENKIDELQNIEGIDSKILVRAAKSGFLPRELSSKIVAGELSESPVQLQGFLTHLPDFAPEMLISIARQGFHNFSKHLLDHPMITSEHKTKALFELVEHCTDNGGNYLNIAKDLLATNQIAVADIKAALEKAQEYCLDELVIILQNHLSNSNLQTSAEANAPTFTPALNEARSNSSQTQAEDVMTLDEMPKDKPCV
ncbi:MAG: hypothetical protein JSS07_10980 [Proteobacteria bacterium]|nr:hypothetical protein [Pseudomonadota bacterium]